MQTTLTTTMLLRNLISNLKPDISRLKIKNISLDSRKVKKGDLFVSIRGNSFDGNNFINEAILKGAKVIVYSGKIKINKKAIFIKVKDTREILAKLSSKYYKKKPKNIVAVTGTNGKTSISDFFNQIFLLQNKKVGFIGTLGVKKNRAIKKRNLTTLDSLELNKDLEEIKKNGIENVIIEASSHGLKQKRLNFIKFKAGIFSNLSHDHLDYHKNMSDYFESKLILFNKLLNKKATIITDSEIKEFKKIKKIQKMRKLKLLAIGHESKVFKITNHKIYKNFQFLEIKYKNKLYKLRINLFGSIQIKNLLMAILASKVCGLKIENIFKKIDKIKSVNGRLQHIRTLSNKSKVFIDYAHTPDALENAILSLREHFQKKITIIFGCGGERDQGKRKLMGMVAKKYCEKIYVTDDNPRNESAKKIRKDIMNVLKNCNAKEISSRKKSIFFALKNSDPYEVILIAGKGHESFQDFGKRKIFLSDHKIVKDFKDSKLNIIKNLNEMKYNASILRKIKEIKNSYLFSGVSINSKKIKKNNLFIAIKGRKNDAHDFLDEAIDNGANYCIVSKKLNKNSRMIKTKNTMNFLNLLAKEYRSTSPAKFIGITGSSGKTTVKTLIGNVLKKYSTTYFSPKSYNNQYGVPLSLCNMNPNDNFGVFEIGMSKFNEINKLSSIVKPDIGIITNISEAHLENFKSIKEIAKAKSEIIYNIKKNGTIILNRDDRFFNYFQQIAKKNNIKIISFGYSYKSDVKFLSLKKTKNKINIKILINKKIIPLNINSPNKTNILNILCCIAVLNELNLNLNKIKQFFKNQEFLNGRGKISRVKKFKKNFFLIDESYNANPLSVKSAIENFSNIKKNGKSKYFLFGDMLELGKSSNILHKNVSKLINNSDIDKTFVYGNKAAQTFRFLKKNKKGGIVKKLKSFNTIISKTLKNGDLLMIKGSNATKLNKISKNFLKGSSNAL